MSRTITALCQPQFSLPVIIPTGKKASTEGLHLVENRVAPRRLDGQMPGWYRAEQQPISATLSFAGRGEKPTADWLEALSCVAYHNCDEPHIELLLAFAPGGSGALGPQTSARIASQLRQHERETLRTLRAALADLGYDAPHDDSLAVRQWRADYAALQRVFSAVGSSGFLLFTL